MSILDEVKEQPNEPRVAVGHAEHSVSEADRQNPQGEAQAGERAIPSDRIQGDVTPPTEVFVQDEDVQEICKGYRIIDPPSHRGGWYRSRLLVNDKDEAEPLLVVLARHKFKAAYNSKFKRPFWLDGNPTNESISNVGLHSVPKSSPRNQGNFRSKIGYPAGTPEYWREYRKQNKDKVNQYYRTRRETAKRDRAELAELRKNPSDRREALLDDILNMVKKPEGEAP